MEARQSKKENRPVEAFVAHCEGFCQACGEKGGPGPYPNLVDNMRAAEKAKAK